MYAGPLMEQGKPEMVSTTNHVYRAFEPWFCFLACQVPLGSIEVV